MKQKLSKNIILFQLYNSIKILGTSNVVSETEVVLPIQKSLELFLFALQEQALSFHR